MPRQPKLKSGKITRVIEHLESAINELKEFQESIQITLAESQAYRTIKPTLKLIANSLPGELEPQPEELEPQPEESDSEPEPGPRESDSTIKDKQAEPKRRLARIKKNADISINEPSTESDNKT